MLQSVDKGSLLWALLAVALSAVVYTPILDNYFWADDFFSLYRINNLPLGQYLFQPLGDHLLVSAFSVFYLTYLAFGTEPQGYFATVLVVQLLNVLLFFLLLRRVTGSDRLACFGALLWGTSPRLEGTLGWYSVFGHALAATAMLTLLYQLAGLERATTLGWRQRVAWIFLVLLAATSFGIGIGIAVLLQAVALLVVPRGTLRRQAVATLAAAAVLVPLLYLTLNRAFNPRYQPVGLARRLGIMVSEPFLAMLRDMAEYGITTALFGIFWPTPKLDTTDATVALVVFVWVVLVPLIGGPPRSRNYALTGVLLALCTYAMVAGGRAAFYVLNPTIAHSDRYQYTAALAIVLALCVGLGEIGRHLTAIARDKLHVFPSSRALKHAGAGAVVAWALALLLYYDQWGKPIEHHDTARRQTARVLEEIRAAAANAEDGSDVYITNRPFPAMGPIFFRSPTFPGSAAVFVIFFPDNTIDGHRVYFVEPERKYYAHVKNGRRTAQLLVPRLPSSRPHAVPPG